MKRKIDFGDFEEDKQEQQKEPHTDKLESQDYSLVIEAKDQEIDRLNTQIENLQARFEREASEARAERTQIQETIDSLNLKLKVKTQEIVSLQTTIKKRNTRIESLRNKVYREEEKNKKNLPSGLKTKIDSQKIEEMKEYALSIADDKQNFYKQIAEKFGVSVGSAYNYTREIYETKFKGESSND